MTHINDLRKFVRKNYDKDGNIVLPRKRLKNGNYKSLKKNKTRTYKAWPHPLEVTDVKAPLPEELTKDLRQAIKNNIIRNKVLTLINSPRTYLISYLYGTYLAQIPDQQLKETPTIIKEPILAKALGRRKIKIPLKQYSQTTMKPKMILLGYLESTPEENNNIHITQLMDDNGWNYKDAGKYLIIPDVKTLLEDTKEMSLDLYINTDNTMKKILDTIKTATSTTINPNNLETFIKYYPGYIFHKYLGGSKYSLNDYKTWDLRQYVKGRQGEALGFKKVDYYMRKLIKEIGLYENEYETVHVLIGTTHYDIPIFSEDLGYIMNKLFSVGTIVDKPKYRVWDAKTGLKKQLITYFSTTYEEINNEDM